MRYVPWVIPATYALQAMRNVFLWSMAGVLFTGAWAWAHYGRFNDAAEFVTVAVLCVIVAVFCDGV